MTNLQQYKSTAVKGLSLVLAFLLLFSISGCGKNELSSEKKELSNSKELEFLSNIDQKMRNLNQDVGYSSVVDEEGNTVAYCLAFDCNINQLSETQLNDIKTPCGKIYETLVSFFASYEMDYFTIIFIVVDRNGNQLYEKTYRP